MRTRSSGALAAMLAAVAMVAAAADKADTAAAPGGLVIAQPGYPGSTEEAREFVAGLLADVRKRGGPDLPGGEYHNDEKAALEAIARNRPAVGIVSLGFYLAHREALGLRPLLSSQPEESFRLLARKGAARSLDDLRGKIVTGTPLLEADLVTRVLLPGRDGEPSPAAGWKREPARFFSRAVRDVARGKADAVLLSAREHEGVKKLRSGDDLELIHETAALPVAIVVRFGAGGADADKADADKAAAGKGFAAALAALSGDDAGRGILETMGLVRFAPIDAERLEGLVRTYAAAAPTAEGGR